MKFLAGMSPPRRNIVIGVTLSLMTVFLSSTIAAVGKHISPDVHVSAMIVAQYSISFLFALPAVMRKGRAGLHTSYLGLHLIRGVSGVACFYFYFFALSQISLLEATLLRSTAPLMVPIVIFLALGHGIRRASIPPLLIGFAGVVLVLRPGFAELTVWHLVALASALGLAVSMISTRMLAATEPSSRILFYYFAISLVVSIPFFLWQRGDIPAHAWPWLLYMGVVIYVCFLLYTLAYRYMSASALAPTSYFGVVFTGMLDWLLWDVLPDGITLCGIALVVCGGVLVLGGRDDSTT
ncbi:MAG: DMT family transporter [Spongiibacter sp.]